MDVTFQADEVAQSLAQVLRDSKAADVQVLDLRGHCSWTDFFVIGTVTSNTHLQGLERQIKEWCAEHEVKTLGKARRPPGASEWHFIDLGPIVIHLMSAATRSFYDLERLWSSFPE
ncbi:ribosomal silencing factor RsfS [Spirochaetia bacterium]|nr:ribosomal silencing factor RsfS [Spirochaetia bacterium]